MLFFHYFLSPFDTNITKILDLLIVGSKAHSRIFNLNIIFVNVNTNKLLNWLWYLLRVLLCVAVLKFYMFSCRYMEYNNGWSAKTIEEVPDFSFKIDFQAKSASFLINFPSNANVSKVKTSLQRSDINLLCQQ